jgi:hypothetical protein
MCRRNGQPTENRLLAGQSRSDPSVDRLPTSLIHQVRVKRMTGHRETFDRDA